MIKIVGLGPGTAEHMTSEAVRELSSADVVVAGRRMLEAVAFLTRARKVELSSSGMAREVVEVLERESKYGNVVLAVSGDPGFYSLARKVTMHFGRDNVAIVPGISSLQLLAAHIGRSWVNVASVTLHGRALPPRSELAKKLPGAEALVVLLGPAQEAIAHIKWIAEDPELSGMWAAVGWDLGLPNELVFEADTLTDLVRCPYVGKMGMLWLEKP